MFNELHQQIHDWEKPIYSNLVLEKKRIFAISAHMEMIASPNEIFNILYKFLNQDSKKMITNDSIVGTIFIRKFNNQMLHYVLTKNKYASEIELATFIENQLFKINFSILSAKHNTTHLSYTESWRYDHALEKSHRSKWLYKNFKKKVREKAQEIKISIFEQLK